MNNKKLISSVIWSTGERVFSFLVSTIISVILARLISPDDFGVLALVTVFVNVFSNVLLNGLGTALVQKKDVTQEDYSTIFIINIAIAIVSYLLLFFCAPAIASFYENESLTRVTRVISLIIPFTALSAIQFSYLQKTYQFKKYCLVTIICITVSGIVGVLAALNNFGIWALVLHHVTKQLIQTIAVLLISGLKIKWTFSKESAKRLVPYGLKSMITTFVNDLEANVRSLVIGKVYTSADLAFYNQGGNFPKIVITTINPAIGRVVFPTFSELQDDLIAYKKALRRAITLNQFIIAPALAGLISVAYTFIITLYTDKWAQAVPYLQILAFAFILRPYENMCNYAIMGKGKSGIILFDMIVTKTVSFITMVIAVFLLKDIQMIAWGVVFTSVVGIVLFAIQVKKMFDYKYTEQVKDVFPTLMLCLMMYLAIQFVSHFLPMGIISLIIQVAVGVIIYVGVAYVLKFEAMQFIIDTVKKKIKKGVA